jgi:hypothetical protein
MTKLITETVKKAQLWAKNWPRSVVLWSGGKDSTAMLHLLRFKAEIDIPVIQFRQPKFRERYAYSDRLIKEWGLTVYEYPASRYALADGPDTETGEVRFDLLHYFQWGTKAVVLSLGTERPKEGEKFMCGLDDFLNRPTGTFNWPWGAVWIGTKGSDTDLIKGHVPLAQDIRFAEGSPVSLYPMRDWTDRDIFQYLEENDVQPDPTRYVKGKFEWGNNPDKSLNADFYPTCLNCVDRHQGSHVHCPKLNATISSISHLAPYEDIVIPDLGFRPVEWNKEEK